MGRQREDREKREREVIENGEKRERTLRDREGGRAER